MNNTYYEIRSLEELKNNPKENIEYYLEFLFRNSEEIEEDITDKMKEYCLEAMNKEGNNTEYCSLFNLEEVIQNKYKDEKIEEKIYKEMKDLIEENKIEYRKNIYTRAYNDFWR